MARAARVKGYVAKELAKDMKRLFPDSVAPELWEEPVPIAYWIGQLPDSARDAAKALDKLMRAKRLPETELLNVAQYGFDFKKNGLLGKKGHAYVGLTCDGDGDMYVLELSTGKVIFYQHDLDRLVPKRSFENLDTFFWILVRISAVNEGQLKRKDVESELLALAQPGTVAALRQLPEEKEDEEEHGDESPLKGVKKGDRKLAKKLMLKALTAKIEEVDFEKAVGVYTKAIAADPSFAEAHFERGTLRLENSDPGGVEDLRKACELAPDHKKAHFALGLGLEKQGDLSGAVAAYSAHLVKDPSALVCRFNCAKAKLALGDKKGGRAELKELLRISGEMGGSSFDNAAGKAEIAKLMR